MYKRYYDGYGSQRNSIDRGQIIVPEKSNDTYEIKEDINDAKSEEITITKKSNGLLEKPLELDDLILIGLLIFLLKGSDETDPILIIIVGYLLISEIL